MRAHTAQPRGWQVGPTKGARRPRSGLRMRVSIDTGASACGVVAGARGHGVRIFVRVEAQCWYDCMCNVIIVIVTLSCALGHKLNIQ